MKKFYIDPSHVKFSNYEDKNDISRYNIKICLSSDEVLYLEKDRILHCDGSDFKMPEVRLIKAEREFIYIDPGNRYQTISIWLALAAMWQIKRGVVAKFEINSYRSFYNVHISMEFDHYEELVL